MRRATRNMKESIGFLRQNRKPPNKMKRFEAGSPPIPTSPPPITDPQQQPPPPFAIPPTTAPPRRSDCGGARVEERRLEERWLEKRWPSGCGGAVDDKWRGQAFPASSSMWNVPGRRCLTRAARKLGPVMLPHLSSTADHPHNILHRSSRTPHHPRRRAGGGARVQERWL